MLALAQDFLHFGKALRAGKTFESRSIILFPFQARCIAARTVRLNKLGRRHISLPHVANGRLQPAEAIHRSL